MMRKLGTLTAIAMVAAGLTGLGSAMTPAHAAGAVMDKYVGSDRPILIFAPDRYDQRLIEQKGRFSIHRREFRDRDVIVIEIGGPFMRAEGRGLPHGPAMRQTYGVSDDEFAIILVGKDGTEKHRISEVSDAQVFYDLIDAMPLRRQELGLE